MTDKNNPFPDNAFKGYEFAKSNMTNAHFNGVNLSDSRFWAVLKNARFTDCNMEAANFDDVNLGSARFHNINLSGVSFSNINMSNVEISDANLDGMRINGVLVSDLFSAYEKSS